MLSERRCEKNDISMKIQNREFMFTLYWYIEFLWGWHAKEIYEAQHFAYWTTSLLCLNKKIRSDIQKKDKVCWERNIILQIPKAYFWTIDIVEN